MGKHRFNTYVLKFSFYFFFLLFFYPLVDKPIRGGKHQNMPILRHILNIFNYFFVFLMVEHSLFCPIDGGVYLLYPYKILRSYSLSSFSPLPHSLISIISSINLTPSPLSPYPSPLHIYMFNISHNLV